MKYSKIADLRNVFLEKNDKAASGKAVIDSYLKQDKNLYHLLRHHDEKKIKDKETWLRDDIDYFLEYFSIIGLGHITGYLSMKELQEGKEEILYYLNIRAVKKYFYENYPLILPQVLLEVLERNTPFSDSPPSSQREGFFYQFHALNQTVENDDVNQFLWFLDDGGNYKYDIDDFVKALSDTQKCFKTRKKSNALGESVRGFFIYLDFLQQFSLFLKGQRHKIDKSAYWMYHAYWIKKIEDQLRLAINKFFNGVEEYVRNTGDYIYPDKIVNSNASRRNYLNLLDMLVYNNEYEHIFLDKLERWRLESNTFT